MTSIRMNTKFEKKISSTTFDGDTFEVQSQNSKDYHVTNNHSTSVKNDPNCPPADRYYLMYLFFLYFGFASMVNMFYVISANDFWMWKFRNTSRPWMGAGDAEHRTELQKSVFSLVMVANSIPALASLVFTIPIVKRTRTRARTYTCYTVYTVVYCVFFFLALMNTDSWQMELEVITLLCTAVNSGVSMILLASCITYLANVPQKYVKAFTLGEGSAHMIISIIQICSLLIADNSRTTGLVYFGLAVTIYIGAILIFFGTTKSVFFRYYIKENQGNDDKHGEIVKLTFDDFKVALSEVWPVIAIYGCCLVGSNLDNVSSLIVSEFRGDGTAWSETYFVPVITMLLGTTLGNLGRICSWEIITPKNCHFFIGINIARAIIYLPLYIGCNAFPRTLPVWFPHDWQYIIILSSFTFTNGFFTTSCLLSLPNFMTGKVQREIYYLLLQITLSTVGFCTAPLNLVVVKFIL